MPLQSNIANINVVAYLGFHKNISHPPERIHGYEHELESS